MKLLSIVFLILEYKIGTILEKFKLQFHKQTSKKPENNITDKYLQIFIINHINFSRKFEDC